MHEALRNVCLQWAAVGSAKEEHDVMKMDEDGNAVAGGEWSGAILAQGPVSRVRRFQGNIAVHLSTTELL